MRRKKILLTTLALALTACQHDTLLHKYRNIADGQWMRSDTVAFTLPVVPVSGMYDLSVGLRYHKLFPYRDLYVIVEQLLSDPEINIKDTVCLQLPLPETSSEIGINILQYEKRIVKLHLQKDQTGKIRISHIMHNDPLPQIYDVGILISQNTPND